MTLRSIGIDLGTTYSCAISADDPAREHLVPNSLGEELTPSVIHIGESGECSVGKEARARMADDPENVVVGIKRRMGTDFPLEFAGRKFTPEGLSALILRSLAADSAASLGVPVEDLRAVITVPAYFGVGEKEATFAAARIAGLECLQLVPEPVSALYAYGLGDRPGSASLVYDLGGGTFDVAVAEVSSGEHRVWAVDGESRLGGLDWDQRIVDMLWEQLEYLDDVDELRYDDEMVAAVDAAAESLKRRLTGSENAKERLRFHGRFISLELNRTAFEKATADLVDRTLEAADRALQTARRLGAPPVERVVLVGGSTRMPMIKQRLAEHYALEVLLADPDRAVARGAAQWAAQLVEAEARSASGGLAVRKTSITSVLPRALGIKLHSSGEPWREEPYVAHFLWANTPLPVLNHRIRIATIVDGQERTKLEVFEQSGVVLSDRLEDNDLLVEGEILLSSSLPAGSPITLDITVSDDGLIRIAAEDPRTTAPLVLEAFMHGVLDDEELAGQSAAVTSLRMVR